MGIMTAPQSGVKVRMYRQGHGDCFLLAFPKDPSGASYMLIDCGLVPGSQTHRDTDDEIHIDEVIEHIRDSTNNHLDLVVITHEHKDHVSGFKSGKSVFGGMQIDQLWLAWTEDPSNELANQLREEYEDTLLGLAAAAKALRDSTEEDLHLLGMRVGDLLTLDADDPLSLTTPGITNKEAIGIVAERAAHGYGTRYLRPHRRPLWLPHVEGVRIFVLGPPEDQTLLEDPDPRSGEGYHFAPLANEARGFFAATHDRSRTSFAIVDAEKQIESAMPFAERYRVDPFSPDTSSKDRSFFEKYYASEDDHGDHLASWRRIDADWLRGAEQFALRLNNYTNNTSLVLAIELRQSRKVLLFSGDAQRGNWVSWDDDKWTQHNGLEPGEEITTEDLLSRTVVYKVGHHGSHNATLRQGLEKMGKDEYAREFVAFIPANSKWAYGKTRPWAHPLPSIKEALLLKAGGRVLQTDIDRTLRPINVSNTEWRRFSDRVTESTLYFEYTVPDEV